ncbi:DoxX family protein [Aurantivibrio infirmus]
MKKYLPWVLALFVAFVFIQSLFFKFTGSEETVIIFSTLGEWMKSIGLPTRLADGFAAHGGIIIGSAELIASILILVPKTRIVGAIMGFFIMSGAIFFHLFTPLGVNRVIDEQGNTDGGVLFFMACGVWLCCLILIFLNRHVFLRKQLS